MYDFYWKMKSGGIMRVYELADNLDEYLVSLKDDELSDNTIKRYNTQKTQLSGAIYFSD